MVVSFYDLEQVLIPSILYNPQKPLIPVTKTAIAGINKIG